ncbi:MAG TPA: glutamate-5-semialdehyde dehydrogenase [Actinomycetota bacterium]|nr:glutamate-5-semialdehyde dehydrogenase [Actinomycetota bacterium]
MRPMGALEPLVTPARMAARALATADREAKDACLAEMASALERRSDEILWANREDVATAERDAAPGAVIDRLRLDEERVRAVAEGLRDIARLPDPVGEVIEERTAPSGIRLQKVRVPLGVIGVIYEGRPNVTVDAAGLCLKAGSAVLLRGSRIARSSNEALVAVLRDAAEVADLPADVVQAVPPTRESAKEMMRARGLIDLLIPRGGNDLIQTVVNESVVPVVETGIGNCHVYVDRAADLDRAQRILVNAKVQRPGVCNAAESFLVHRDVADAFLPGALEALRAEGVEVLGDEEVQARGEDVAPASDDDHRAEFLDLRISGKVVGSLDEAIEHIAEYGTRHTEAIVTEDAEAAERFVREVDAAAVVVNASTRFTDGGEFGMGAEIGISTQKLHARGPMALSEITTYKWIVRGDGHVRG